MILFFYLFIDFGERKAERKTVKHGCESEALIGCLPGPDPGLNLQLWHVPDQESSPPSFTIWLMLSTEPHCLGSLGLILIEMMGHSFYIYVSLIYMVLSV